MPIMISGLELVWMLWKMETFLCLLGIEPYMLVIKPGVWSLHWLSVPACHNPFKSVVLILCYPHSVVYIFFKRLLHVYAMFKCLLPYYTLVLNIKTWSIDNINTCKSCSFCGMKTQYSFLGLTAMANDSNVPMFRRLTLSPLSWESYYYPDRVSLCNVGIFELLDTAVGLRKL